MPAAPLDPSIVQALATLEAHAQLHGLSPETMAALREASELRTVPDNTQVLCDRSRSDALYLILQGRLIVTWRGEDRRAPLRAVLQAGDTVGEDALVDRGTVGAVSLGRATLLRMEASAVRRLAATYPDLAQLLDRMTAIQGRRGWVLRALRKSPLFRAAAPADLSPLLRAAHLLRAGPNEQLLAGTDELPGVLVVLDGDVTLRASGPVRVGRKSVTPPELAMGQGAVIGDVAMAEGVPLLHDVVAGADGCAVLVLPRANFEQAFNRSLSFRRAILSSPVLSGPERARLLLSQARAMGGDMRVFQAVVADDPSIDLSTPTRWLAEAAAEEWGDRVAIVRPDPAHPGEPTVRVEELGQGQVHTVVVPATLSAPSRALVQALLRCDMAFLDLGALPPAQRAGPWMARVQRLVAIGTRAYERVGVDQALEVGADLPLYTAVVPGEAPAPGAARTVPYGTARIHRDLLAEAQRGTSRGALAPGLRDQVHRWMRAVTGRRLGVALGGGGALSFSELAVLQRLHEEGIPVDMVAGVSGGSIVGSFYVAGDGARLPRGKRCPQGLEDLPGLALLTVVGDEMERASLVALVTGWSVVSFLERYLGHPRLEDLLVPFFPVTVDGEEAVQTHLRMGPLAYGARASGSFPGTFTPTTLDLKELRSRVPLPGRNRRDLPGPEDDDRTYEHHLDGGLLNNIPDDTLFLEGAQVVLACNVVPAPGPRKETGNKLAVKVLKLQKTRHSRIGRFFNELSPIVRYDDLYRAIYMLMFQPADWAARTADVKFQATTRGFAFTAWSEGDAIRKQTLTEGAEHVERAIAQVKRARENLRWKRHEDVDPGAIADVVMALIAPA